MNVIQTTLQKLDRFQQSHHLPGFTYAVIKKYGDDTAGYQAALLTYYGFLSLFPLLLVLTTVASLITRHNPHAQATIVHDVTNYFPVLGDQLSAHIQTLHRSGLALVIGLLFTLYGARGIADAFRHGVNHIWQVPLEERDGFPKSLLKSVGLIIIGGIGLIIIAITTALASSAGHELVFRLLSILVNVLLLFVIFTLLINLSLPRHISFKQTRGAAATAAIGLAILQLVGGYLVARELKSLDALYSYFAIALGLLFWIYLQAQVIYYAVEVASVKSERLWPRSLSGQFLTAADKRVYARLAAKERMLPKQREHITTDFPEN